MKNSIKTQATAVATQSDLVTKSVQQFMEDNGFVSVVNVVRANTNDYLYVTFMNADNEAENIYFSKAASELTVEGEAIAKGFFDQFTMSLVVYTDGREARWKISSANGGNRVTVADLF